MQTSGADKSGDPGSHNHDRLRHDSKGIFTCAERSSTGLILLALVDAKLRVVWLRNLRGRKQWKAKNI
jgi:hypothetical protein